MSKKIENENIKVIATLDRKIVEFEGFRKRICKLKEVDRISTIHCAQWFWKNVVIGISRMEYEKKRIVVKIEIASPFDNWVRYFPLKIRDTANPVTNEIRYNTRNDNLSRTFTFWRFMQSKLPHLSIQSCFLIHCKVDYFHEKNLCERTFGTRRSFALHRFVQGTRRIS